MGRIRNSLNVHFWTRKKVEFYALQRSAEEREAWLEVIMSPLFVGRCVIAIDESHFFGYGEQGRTHGWAPWGATITLARQLSRGGEESFSYLAACNHRGMVLGACELLDTKKCSVDAERLRSWAARRLIPCLGNWSRCEPNSLVVLDNASIHRDPEFLAMITATGAIYAFLSP